MEHFKRQPLEEQSCTQSEADSTAAHGTVPGYREFERNGERYGEVSFLHEPIERYQDDLMRLDIVIEHKKQALREAEAHKVAYIKKELGHLEITRTMTLHRLGLLAKQDRLEQDLLDDLSADKIEH